MNSNCMHGAAHPGEYRAVRNKRGATLGWVCELHYQKHHKVLEDNGYHFRTADELMARGEQHGGRLETGTAPASMDTLSPTEQQQPEYEYPGWDQETAQPPSELSARRNVDGRPLRGVQNGRDSHREPESSFISAPPAQKELETLPSRETASSRGLPTRTTEATAVVTPEWPAWTEGAGHLTLTADQQATLMRPFRDEEITIRYDGVVYAPWRRYWSRMIDAFSPHLPSILPVDNPRFHGTEIVVGVVMVVEGKFIGKAWGSHRLEGENDRMSVGDRIESAISDAIAKIGKRLNMGEELWDDSFRDYWKSQYAESYQKGNRTYWKRRPFEPVEEHE